MKPSNPASLARIASGDANNWKILPREFFNAPPESVARTLLGKILVRSDTPELLAGRIVETEAYLGDLDPAAHTASGRTARNSVLFGPPGYAYVYSIYGMHYCLNVSCLADGDPGGVLFRALEPVAGIPSMRENRGLDQHASIRQLTSGPGKLCQALGITRATHNGRDLTAASESIYLCDDGCVAGEIAVTPRVGIRKAADLPLRFFLAGNACVSARGR